MTVQTNGYDELYAVLAQLCEQQAVLVDEAHVDIMEAFNSLSDLHVPEALPVVHLTHAGDLLSRAVALLDRLATGSRELAETLRLVELRRLLGAALDKQP